MILKIDGTEIVSPKEFSVTILDLDDSEASVRTADGTLNRDRIAIKKQITMSWGVLSWSEMSTLLTAMSPIYFEFYYPDPQEGAYVTKTMYVGNRPAPVSVSAGGDIKWSGLKAILTER
jgi:hypothetical protein